MLLILTGHRFRTPRQAAQLSFKAKRLLLVAAILSAATILSGCGHGPWFHGRGHGRGHGYYNGQHDSPRYHPGPGRYRDSDDNYYYRRR